MKNVKISCTLVSGDQLPLEYDGPELIELLAGDDTGAKPKYLTIEADGPDGEMVRISIPNSTGEARVTIERKPTN